jgi:hypothetical protein
VEALIVALAFTALVSALVFTLTDADPVADGFVIPASVTDVDMLAGSEQLPPLLASVTVAVSDDPVAVAEQFANPLPRVTAGLAGSVNPDGNTTVIVSPPRSAPLALESKLAVQAARALAASDVADTAAFATEPTDEIVAPALTAEASALVFTLTDTDPVEDGFVSPDSMSEVEVLAGSEQVPPLFASVTVAVSDAPVAVAEQFAKPVPTLTVGLAGTVNPAGNTSVTVSPTRSAPLALESKLAVQAARALAASEDDATDTFASDVAAAIVAAAFTAAVSTPVFTLTNTGPAEDGFVIPASVSDADVPAANEQLPPLLVSVTVAVSDDPEAVAEQFEKPAPSATAGVAGTAAPEGNTSVTVSPDPSAPLGLLESKFAVQLARALAASEVAETDTFDGAVAATIVALAFTAAVSALVFTLSVLAPVEDGLLIPATVSEAAVLAGSEQVPPLFASVTVAVVPEPDPVAAQFVKPLPRLTDGVVGTVNPDANVSVIVSPVRSEPDALDVNAAVQAARALAASELALTDAPVTDVAAVIETFPLTTVVSTLLNTVSVFVAAEPGFVIPPSVSELAVSAASRQLPPLFASVTVTTEEAPVALAVQFANSEPSVTDGLVGTENPDGNVTLSVSPARSAPEGALERKFAVQLARAFTAIDVAPYETLESVVAVLTASLALTADVSALVFRLSVFNPSVFGFVTPATVTELAVFAGNAHTPPLSASVTVTVNDAPEPVAEQLANPAPSVTDGDTGTVKPEANVSVSVSPVRNAPVAVELKFAVQLARALAAKDVASRLNVPGLVAASITTGDPGLSGVESADVFTLKLAAAIEPAAGFVTPAIVSDAGVLAGSTHDPPASVTVTVPDELDAVAVQLKNPDVNCTVGDAGTVNVFGNTTVTVPPPLTAPVELDENPTAHVDRAPPVCGDPANETLETDGSIVYGSGKRESSSRNSNTHPSDTGRRPQRAPGGVTATPSRSKISTGATCRPIGFPPRKNSTAPSRRSCACMPGAASRQRHVRTPCRPTTV